MTTSRAQTIVNISAAVTLASTTADTLFHTDTVPREQRVRRLVAGLLAFAGLGIVAEIAPEVGAGLAIAVGATAAATYALPLVIKQFPETTDTPQRPRGSGGIVKRIA